MKKRIRDFKRLWSILLSLTLILSCMPQLPMMVYAEEIVEKTSIVSTESEFMSALKDESVEIIELSGDITLSRSLDGNDNLFVIPRSVTIRGGRLFLERAGIILNGAVTFEQIDIYFSNAVRNVIIANGNALTLDTVTNGGSSYNIDIFCGGITDYNGGNSEEIPAAGTDANITIKGKNNFGTDNKNIKGGNIFAGSLSDVGYDSSDKSNTYNGNVTITIEKEAAGVGEIYAHGARENRDGGYANEWKSSASLYSVDGTVTVSLKTNAPITLHGETGGVKNAVFSYTDDGNGYPCYPTLKNVSGIELYPSVDGKRAILQPTFTGTEGHIFDTLSVPANTRLSFIDMDEVISVTDFAGGGELIFKEENQKLDILRQVNGMTKIAVGGVAYDGVSSTGNIVAGKTYITVGGISEDYGFELLPSLNNSSMIVEDDGNGNWIIKVLESDIIIQSITDLTDVEIAEGEMDDVVLPVAVVFGESEAEALFLSDIPMFMSINGRETSKVYGVFGYDYAAGEADSDLFMWFQPSDTSDMYNEELYITRVNSDVGFSAGKYEISIVIPARYMVNDEPYTLGFTLMVTCEEHTGGTATCTQKAVCEICGESYGETDSSNHSGGTATCIEKAKCERCGEAYGEVDSSNHSGGTELRGEKEATETEPGYTGDTYCLGCNTKLATGEEIPKLPQEEETKTSIETAVITLSSESYIYDGMKKEPEITVVLENKTLTINEDYTVTYENNDRAGTACVIVAGTGAYEGTQTKLFKIHTGGIATCTQKAVCEICGESYGETDSGNHSGGNATCTEKAKCERCGEAYGEVDSSNHSGGTELRGEKEATETEPGYTGDTYCLGCNTKLATGEEIPKLPQEEEPKTSIETAVITLSSESYIYDGTKKEPEITVVLENKTLTINEDYTVTYENNDRAGTARVIVAGTGAYEGIRTKLFKIHTGGIATCTQKAVCEICGESYGETDSSNHSGGIATCTEKAKCERCGEAYGEVDSSNHSGGTELRGEKEATETEPGYTGDTYCRSCGVKLFSGEIIPMLVVEPEEIIISIESATISLEETGFYYDGKEKTPDVKIVVDGKTLSEGTDYTVEYKDNKNIGTAAIIINGKGNYKGTIKKTFTIKAQKGKMFTAGKYKYKVTADSTVAFNGIKSNSTTKIVVPKAVFYGGKLFTVSSIAENALKNKKKVTQITLDENIKSIGASAFYGCSKLKTIIIHTENLTQIGTNALKGVHSKAVIKVPSKKYSSYRKLFKGKVSIVIQTKKGEVFTSGNNNYKITGSSSVEFTGLKNVKKTEAVIPKTVNYGGIIFKVTAIADKALKGNTKVKKVTIGENVKKIGAAAFYGCKNLKTISIKSTRLESVGKNVLKGISSKATIYVPKNKFNAYIKLLKNKGQGSKVKIVKAK